MKGSAVVQGFKCLVSKLHPQLPLDPKESQRLLTALTDSFRHHLDQVHPHQAREDGSKALAKGGVAKAPTHAYHSSATTADKLMSSVLTSPLLVKHSAQPSKADRDYAKMKVDLQDASKDPITLLEEYQERGATTLPIAALCLHHFGESIKGLSEDAKTRRIQEHQPGRRTLLWLWKTELYTSTAFTEHKSLMASLAHFMIVEDLERYLWEWLKLDIGSVEGQPEGRSKLKALLYKYRWKSHLLRTMLSSKLQSGFVEGQSADAALDTFFRASELYFPSADASTHTISPGPVGSLLHRELTSDPVRYSRTGVEGYDRFIRLVDRWCTSSVAELNKATLRLWHPQEPSGLPAYYLLKRLCMPTLQVHTGANKIIFQRLQNPRDDAQRVWFCRLFIATARALGNGGYFEEEKWMNDAIATRWPDLARRSERNGKKTISTEALSQQDDRISDRLVSRTLPFPTLADPLRS